MFCQCEEDMIVDGHSELGVAKCFFLGCQFFFQFEIRRQFVECITTTTTIRIRIIITN